jgi:osmoprotectant transport system permease protein
VLELAELTLQHLGLVVTSMVVACALGLPLAVLLTRKAAWRSWVLRLIDIVQTIPSLALFGLLIPVPVIGGIGKRTAIVALVAYALLPIVRNALTGILGVDPGVRESALAMGMSQGQILREVELPLASQSILAGIHIAMITTIGTATIAAAIGGGGLGVLIFRGISTADSGQIAAGAISAAVLALAADWGLRCVETRFSSR